MQTPAAAAAPDGIAVTPHPDRALPAFTLAGLTIRTDNARASESIGALWQEVHRRNLLAAVPHGVPLWHPEVPLVAVYSDYASDHAGPFTLTVGVPVAPGSPAPGGDLVLREVPPLRYAHLEAAGPSIPAVIAAWRHVWQALTPRRAFSHDLEIYHPARADRGPVDLFVSLR
jgi:predicted transcriptional regulator YdeE